MKKVSLIALLGCVLFTTASCSQEKESLPTQLPKDTSLRQVNDEKSCFSKTLSTNNRNLTPLKDSLECIHIEYSRGNIQQMLSLDSQLELLITEIRNTAPKELWGILWDEKYEELGLINAGELKYTGKLKSEYGKFQALTVQLNSVITAYAKLPKTIENAENLFALDYEIRRIIRHPEMSKLSLGFFEFKEIGVYIDRGGLKYTGKLMTEADNLISPTIPAIQINAKSPNEDELADTLAHIYTEYKNLPTEKNAKTEKLVLLNEKLYEVVEQIVKVAPNTESPNFIKFWKSEYSEIGLEIGGYSDQLEYDGKLILEAHATNPHTRFREDTLLAYIYRNVHWSGGHPETEELYAYLKEFPKNNHTSGIYGNLANFQHGLFAFLRYKPSPSDNYYEFRIECYPPFVTDHPIEAQALAAQKLGIEYYKKAIAESHGAARQTYANELISLELGENLERDDWCDGIL